MRSNPTVLDWAPCRYHYSWQDLIRSQGRDGAEAVRHSRNGTHRIHGSNQFAYNARDEQPLGKSWEVLVSYLADDTEP